MKYEFFKEGDADWVKITVDENNTVCRPATEKDHEDAKAHQPVDDLPAAEEAGEKQPKSKKRY
jgi:hypothetical protein